MEIKEKKALATLQELQVKPFFDAILLNYAQLLQFYSGESAQATEFVGSIKRLIRYIFQQPIEELAVKDSIELSKTIKKAKQSLFFKRTAEIASLHEIFPIATQYDGDWIIIPKTSDIIDSFPILAKQEVFQLAKIRIFTTFGILADRGNLDKINVLEFYYSFLKYMVILTQNMHMRLLEVTIKCILLYILPQLDDIIMLKKNAEITAKSSLYNQLAMLLFTSITAKTLTFEEVMQYITKIYKLQTVENLLLLRTKLLHQIHIHAPTKVVALLPLLNSRNYAHNLPFFNQYYFLASEKHIPTMPEESEYLITVSSQIPPILLPTENTNAFRYFTTTYGKQYVKQSLPHVLAKLKKIQFENQYFIHIMPIQQKYAIYKIQTEYRLFVTEHKTLDEILQSSV